MLVGFLNTFQSKVYELQGHLLRFTISAVKLKEDFQNYTWRTALECSKVMNLLGTQVFINAHEDGFFFICVQRQALIKSISNIFKALSKSFRYIKHNQSIDMSRVSRPM